MRAVQKRSGICMDANPFGCIVIVIRAIVVVTRLGCISMCVELFARTPAFLKRLCFELCARTFSLSLVQCLLSILFCIADIHLYPPDIHTAGIHTTAYYTRLLSSCLYTKCSRLVPPRRHVNLSEDVVIDTDEFPEDFFQRFFVVPISPTAVPIVCAFRVADVELPVVSLAVESLPGHHVRIVQFCFHYFAEHDLAFVDVLRVADGYTLAKIGGRYIGKTLSFRCCGNCNLCIRRVPSRLLCNSPIVAHELRPP